MKEALSRLGGDDFDQRMHALHDLQDAEPNESRLTVAAALEKATTDSDPHVREAAWQAYVRWAEPDQSVPRLLDLMTSSDRRLRAIAIRGLGSLGDERAVVPLVQRLANADDRREASKALQVMGSKVEMAVAGCLQDPDLNVRHEACRILKVVGTNHSIALLEQAARREEDALFKRLAKDAIDAIQRR